MPVKILRLQIVSQRASLSRSTIYRKVAEGTFPKPVKLSSRAIGWKAEDIDAWINSLGGSANVKA